jgi:hypothetical protein
LRSDPNSNGFLGWLDSFKHNSPFWATLSANTEGLRVLVASDKFAIFIPWSQAVVTAERGSPASIARLTTAVMPSLDLVFHLDDEAADELFQQVIPRLPKRDPPRRLFWWLDRPWLAATLFVASISVAVITWYISRATLNP